MVPKDLFEFLSGCSARDTLRDRGAPTKNGNVALQPLSGHAVRENFADKAHN